MMTRYGLTTAENAGETQTDGSTHDVEAFEFLLEKRVYVASILESSYDHANCNKVLSPENKTSRSFVEIRMD